MIYKNFPASPSSSLMEQGRAKIARLNVRFEGAKNNVSGVGYLLFIFIKNERSVVTNSYQKSTPYLNLHFFIIHLNYTYLLS